MSRAKLVYIDQKLRAAPVCIIAPISFLGSCSGSNLEATGYYQTDLRFSPRFSLNLYALLSIAMIFIIILTGPTTALPVDAAEAMAARGYLGAVKSENEMLGILRPRHGGGICFLPLSCSLISSPSRPCPHRRLPSVPGGESHMNLGQRLLAAG